MRIMIAVATYNRPRITSLCLENLARITQENDADLVIYDDCSTSYDYQWLSNYARQVIVFPRHIGIEASRARAFRDFAHVFTNYELIYLTDNDTIHDPSFVQVLRDIFDFQSNNSQSNPVGLFRSHFHENAVTVRSSGFFLSKTCPGVSQCYTREMVERIVSALDTNSTLEFTYGWDYHFPSVLDSEFLLTEVSYLQHFGRDKYEGGIHASNSGPDKAAFLQDFARDSAINPSKYLIDNQSLIIDSILGNSESDI
jgi:glycosyltransferase involved in cell wall biosynthesis